MGNALLSNKKFENDHIVHDFIFNIDSDAVGRYPENNKQIIKFVKTQKCHNKK